MKTKQFLKSLSNLQRCAAVLLLLLIPFTYAWGDTTYYLQGISGSAGTSSLTEDFYTTATFSQSVSVSYGGVSYSKAVKFGGNITAITNNNYPDRMIRYDCKTTRTDFVIVAYANSNSKILYYGNIKEAAKGSANTVTAYSSQTLNNGSITPIEYSISSSTQASLFVSVGSNSNAFVVQIIATEKGDPLPTPGSVGYKVNFNKTRAVARSDVATMLDNNLEIHSNENITAGSTEKIKMQTKGTNYIKFTTAAACVAKITINGIGNGFYVADDKGATKNASALQNDGNKTYELAVGSGTHYIVPNGSNMYVEYLELAAAVVKDYTVTAATSTGTNTYGTVSAGASLLDQGETTTITATPATGYQVTNWAVSGTDASISPSGPSNATSTTLTMGSANATVTVTFGPVYASGTYTFTGHQSCGTSPNNKEISSSAYTNYDAFRVDELFFSATKMRYETGGEAQYDGWKIQYKDATIKFLVENDCNVKITLGANAGMNITYTRQNSTETTTALSANMTNSYDVEGGTLVTLTTTSSSTITLKEIQIAPSCSAPTTTFGNGEYTVGGSALDLSTLIGSNNSSGAITYTVKNANGTGASISTASFTATTAGTCTVTATQAANGDKCEKVMDATITVNATPSISSFSPASGSTIKSGTTITVSGSSSSTVYCLWASSTPSASDVKGGTAGTSGAATVTSAGIASANGTTLYAVATRGGATSSISSASYTIDDTAPTLLSSDPANGATGVATSGTIVLTFSEAIANVDGSKVTLTGATKGAVAKDGSNNTKVNIPYSGAANSATVTLATTAGAVSDAAGNTSAALSNISFTTVAAATYTVTYDGSSNDDGTVPEDGTSYSSGATVTVLGNTGSMTRSILDAPATFLGWNTSSNMYSGTHYDVGDKFEITSDITLYAVWGFNIYYKDEDKSTEITGLEPTYYIYGEGATLPTNPTPPTGYEFGGWYNAWCVDEEDTGASPCGGSAPCGFDDTHCKTTEIETTDTWDAEYYAKWTANSYTITLNKGDHGAANQSASVLYDATALTSITHVTATGYDRTGYFDGSTKVLNADGSFANDDITGYITDGKWSKTADASLTAKWSAQTYTISYKDQGDNTYSGSNGGSLPTSHTYGNATDFVNGVKSGYRFMGWYTDASCTVSAGSSIGATAITANTTYYAKWAQLYTITNGEPSNGTITVVTEAIEGETVSITATPSSGYRFDAWNIYKTGTPATTISPAAATASTSFTMPAYAVTVDVTFALNTYDVTTTLNHTTKASGTTGTGAATHGTEYSATFTAADGYVLPSDVTVTIGGVAQTKGTGYTWSVSAGVGTFTVPAAKVTGAIALTITSTVDCPSANSGRTVYKFVTKSSDLGTGQVCAAANTDYPQTTSNALSEISGGALIARGTGSLTQLSYNKDCYNFNGTNCWLKMELDCELKSGDIIRYINKNSGSVYIRHTSNTTTTDQITLAGNSKTTIQTIVVPANFATKSTIYMIRASNTSYISYFEIIRPYVVTLNANTNGGKVDGEDTKTMYFVADEAQLLPRATKSDYLFKGWFNASSGGDAVANPYTATTSPKTLYAQFDDCSSKIGTVYKLQVKTELTNGSIAAGDLNEGNYLSAMDGGTAVITGSHAQIVNNNAIDFKDNGDYITVNLDCELKAGDYFKTTISGSKSGIKVTTTGSTTSLQDISYGTNVETEVPASLVGSKTFRIYRQDSNCGGLSYFEIVRPAGSEVTYNNGGHGEAPSSTTAAAVTLADISVTGWKNTGWKADVDVKVSGSTVSAETEIAVGTVVTILEATTFTAQWVDCCFEFTSSSQSSSISAITTNANIPASTWETATLTGGTMKNTSSGSLSVNKTYGMVMESGKEVTVTLADDHALGVGSVITLSAGVSDASGSQTSGLVVSGNTCSPASYTSSTAGAAFTQTYTVTALDGLAGTKSFTIAMKSDLTKTYLNGITVTGCVECTPITPSLNYDKTTLWVNDGDIATPTLDKDESTGSVTYSSSNTDIATVNESTGVVKAVAGGNVTITASIAADGTHCANTATCNLTIKNAACGEIVIAGVTLSEKNAGTPEGTLIASSSGYVVSTQKWEAPDGGCGTGGKLGAEGNYVCLTLKSGESFQNGDKVILDIAKVSDVGDNKLHIYAGTSSAGTQLGENASPVCGENEIILSGISSSTPSITLYRTNGDDKQNPYVVSMKVKRFICTDCLGFFDGTDNGSWNTAGNWIGSTGVSASVPTASDRVHIYKPVTVSGATAALASEVILYTNTPTNTGKLTIASDGVLKVAGTIQAYNDATSTKATAVSDVIIDCDNDHQGALIFENPSGDKQAQGTVNFYTKSSRVGGKLQWQYVGYPFESGHDYDYGGYYINKYSESQGGWIVMRNQGDRRINAWEGLAISGDGAGGASMTGTFVPTTGDKELTLTYNAGKGKGKNLIGNSWTAPIQILEMEEEDFGGARAAIYVFNTGRYGSKEVSPSGSWVTLAIDAVKAGVAAGTWTNLTVIPAFQGFQVKTAATEDKTLTLNYDKHVRPATDDTAMNVPLRAPARRANSEINHMRLTVESDVAHQDVFLFEGPEFSEDFDNGWDGDYVGVSGQHAYLYVVSPTLGKMAIDAESSLEGRIVALQSAAEKEYTFTFAGNGMGYYLNDLKTQTSTLIEAGNSYTFTYEQGDDYNRFMISATPFAKTTPTGIEDADWNGTGVQKVLYKDHMYIIRCGRVFDATGAMVK